MIDIDFLIELIKDEMLIVGTRYNTFYSITRNFHKKEMNDWETIYLYHPETSDGCHFEFYSGNWSQKVSKEDYYRIIEYAAVSRAIPEKSDKNQEILLNYMRQKIFNYDNGINKKL